MYVGRLACVGKTNGRLWAGYRVSSRSFPDRHAVKLNDSTVAIMPKGVKGMNSPYLSYNCVKVAQGSAIVANGVHTDLIIEKIAMGYPARDAIALSLLAMDYEKDALDTPRIAGAIAGRRAYLGIVARGGLNVSEVPLNDGDCFMVAVYGKTSFSRLEAEAASAGDVAKRMYGLMFEYPVCAAGVYEEGDGFEIGVYNGQ